MNMGDGARKQYLPLAGKPMIYHALRALCAAPRIDRVLVVLAEDDTEWPQTLADEFADKLIVLRCGGATRAQSVLNGLDHPRATRLIGADDWVLVHDAARPCLGAQQIEHLLDALENDPVGGLLAVPLADTLKRADAQQRVCATEPRENLWQAQTPQMFRYRLLREALAAAAARAMAGITDEAGAVEALGYAPKLVHSEGRNLKVTYPQDKALAELILLIRQGEVSTPFGLSLSKPIHLSTGSRRTDFKHNLAGSIAGKMGEKNEGQTMRIGQGYDSHQLVVGRALVIGGVTVPFDKGLLGHSDADVLLHAICDALLGAAGLGDIGRHFSDSDARYKNIDSRVLLREVRQLLEKDAYAVVNLDATIIAQAPKLAAHIPAMVENLAQDLRMPASDINIKAKTAEHMGALGRGEGMAAQAVCLIAKVGK